MTRTGTEKPAVHDHAACVEHAVASAVALCGRQGLNLTPVRRRVLEIVWRSHGPIGAYQILAELSKEREKAAPPTVYRALEFLVDAGLVRLVPNTKDGRSKCVMLTDGGRRFRDDAIARLQPEFDLMSRHLPAGTITKVLPVLTQMREYLDRERDG